MKDQISIEVYVQTSLKQAWDGFNKAEHIKHWYFADPSWHVRDVNVMLEVGKEFHIYMEAKDKSFGFDFCGTYQVINPYTYVLSFLEDGRRLEVHFNETDKGIHVIETFEIEYENDKELQRQGWQSILNQFKRYVESF
jgi:uncharacterized protein YndB with AHSA1/START domain